MAQKLSDSDQRLLAEKEALREEDRRAVAQGEATWRQVNRENTFGAHVLHLYRPIKKRRGAR